MLTDEENEKVKVHLLEQLDNFPEDQRKLIKHKILSMNNEEMEEFLKENNLDYSNQEEKKEQPCIFCLISEGKIKSFKIDENESHLAILELNPLSKGHTLILPKKHIELKDLKEETLEFAKKVSEKLVKKLKPKEIKLSKNEVLGHGTLEIIPVFDEEIKERKKATEEELQALQKEIIEEKPKDSGELVENTKVAGQEEGERSAGGRGNLIQEEPKKQPLPELPKELPKIPLRLKWI